MSLESPQLEDGFTPVANPIMEALAHTQLSGYEWRVLLFLLRKTYGWSKRSDVISLSQFVDGTGLDRRHVARTIKGLTRKRIIEIDSAKLGTSKMSTYTFNKHFGEWVASAKLGTTSANLGTKGSAKLGTHNINPYNIKEEQKSSPHSKDSIDFQGVQDAWTSICVPAGLHAVRDWSVWNDRIKTAWRRIAASKDSAWSGLSPLERFRDLFTHASKTPFLTGGNDRKWKADLEFVLRPISVDRIMSGFYDDKQSTIQRGLTDVHAWDDVKGW